MDPVTYAITEVKHRIPPQILSIIFGPTGNILIRNTEAVDSALRDKVIEGRVRHLCDTAGAMMTEIPLEGLSPERLEFAEIDRYSYLFRIPKERTNGRRITSALAIAFGNASQGVMAYQVPYQTSSSTVCGSSAMMSAAGGILAANTPIPVTQSALLTIVGENVVMVEDFIPRGRNLFLRCILSNDTEFSNVKPQSMPAFAEMVVLATKAYIYNNYIINLGKGYLMGGQELPEIKDIISEYRDAEELLQTYLKEKWYKISRMNDGRRFQRQLHMLASGNI